MRETTVYLTAIDRAFPDLLPTEKKTFENLYRHLLNIAKAQTSTAIFQTARTLLADKLDYIRRHKKTEADGKRMFVKALVTLTGYTPKRFDSLRREGLGHTVTIDGNC